MSVKVTYNVQGVSKKKKKKNQYTKKKIQIHSHTTVCITYPTYLKLWHMCTVYRFYICIKKLEEKEILFDSINFLDIKGVYSRTNHSVFVWFYAIYIFFFSMSLFLFCIQGYCYHLLKFHIYAVVYCIGLYLSGLLHSVEWAPVLSISLELIQVYSFLMAE